MEPDNEQGEFRRPVLGAGQVALEPAARFLAPTDQVRHLYRLSDPALSELRLEDLLDELLVRVRQALDVDTVAILLLDPDSNELVARAAKGVEEEVERGVRVPLGQGFAGRIATERVAIYIAELDQADVVNPILREKGIRDAGGAPDRRIGTDRGAARRYADAAAVRSEGSRGSPARGRPRGTGNRARTSVLGP